MKTKISYVMIIVELWADKPEPKLIGFREVQIDIGGKRPIDQRTLGDASSRAVNNALDQLKNNLDNQ